jgi:predicted DNA-binding protein (MmcQ/YjbR family)
MTPEQFHAAALALRGAAFDIKWGADRCYTVGGKMFAVAGLDGDAPAKFAFKASDAADPTDKHGRWSSARSPF